MARIRTIKPQHWSDKELVNISMQAHLLWIGLWNFSDDEGIFENDSLLIKSQIFPRHTDVRVEQVSQWIDQLVKARYIVPFTHEGIGYFIHRTFRTHQKIDKPQPSKVPKEVIRRVFDECSTTIRPCIVEDSKSIVEEIAPPVVDYPGTVTYNAEDSIKANPIRYEQVLMKTGVSRDAGADSLRKYHLHLEEKEQYPKGVKAVFAGFEKWLMNEKKFNANSPGATEDLGKTRMVI